MSGPGRVPQRGAPAPGAADASVEFHYTLHTTTGTALGECLRGAPLSRDDEVEVDGERWRVFAVTGGMATLTPAQGPAAE